MTLSTRITKRLAGLALALAIGGATLAAAPAAQASTPCNTAPNYCHIDSDYVGAGTDGASVEGRLYWDSAGRAHYQVTLRDRITGNSRYAILYVRVRVGGNWSTVKTWTTWGSLNTGDRTLTAGGRALEYVEFRVGQEGQSWVTMATDTNRYLYD